MTTREIYCCGCGKKVDARLTDGTEIYPHRKDLAGLPFWKCDACGNSVGCHHKTTNRTHPLGIIATPEIKRERQRVHRLLDPLWKSGGMDRRKIYEILTQKLGWKYHSANIRSVEEGRKVYIFVQEIARKSSEIYDDSRRDVSDMAEEIKRNTLDMPEHLNDH